MQIEFKTVRYAPHMEQRECAFFHGELMRTTNRRAFSWPMVLLLKPLAQGRLVTRLQLLEASGLWLDTVHVFEARLSRLRKELALYRLRVSYRHRRGYRLEKIEEKKSRAA